jgi:hypothetical protein
MKKIILSWLSLGGLALARASGGLETVVIDGEVCSVFESPDRRWATIDAPSGVRYELWNGGRWFTLDGSNGFKAEGWRFGRYIDWEVTDPGRYRGWDRRRAKDKGALRVQLNALVRRHALEGGREFGHVWRDLFAEVGVANLESANMLQIEQMLAFATQWR